MTVLAFHRPEDLTGVAPLLALNALEERIEPVRAMGDIELFEQLAIG